MLGPHSMPIGFTYDGDPLYAAPPVASGESQPLAVLAGGEPVFPAPGDVVPVGQPQPFGVLASGAFVWAVEQRPAAPPVPWFRRRRLVVPAAAVAAALAVGVAAAAGGGAERRQQAAPAGAEAAAEQEAAEQEAAEAAEQEAAEAAEAAAEQEAAEQEAAEQEAAAEQEQEPGAAPDADAPRLDFLMPDLTGSSLQDAQDEVQALGVFFSLSDDLLGSRSQVRDAGWRVCTQSPAAGTRVRGDATDWEGRISFGVVRLEEACP